MTPLSKWPMFGHLKHFLTKKVIENRPAEECQESWVGTLEKPFVGNTDTGCSVFRIDMTVRDSGNAAGCFADLRQCIGIIIQKENLDAIPVARNWNCAADAHSAFVNMEMEPSVFWLAKGPFDIFQQSWTAFKPR